MYLGRRRDLLECTGCIEHPSGNDACSRRVLYSFYNAHMPKISEWWNVYACMGYLRFLSSALKRSLPNARIPSKPKSNAVLCIAFAARFYDTTRSVFPVILILIPCPASSYSVGRSDIVFHLQSLGNHLQQIKPGRAVELWLKQSDADYDGALFFWIAFCDK